MHSNCPVLIVIFGLPGTGKTTFATLLSKHLGYKHYNTDIIRNLSGKSHQYDEEKKALIYDKMLQLTRVQLAKGKSVVIDATFYKKDLRNRFKDLAKEFLTTVKWIEVCANEEVVKKRISKKRKYSEADYLVYQKIKSQFEPMEEEYIQVFSDREEMQLMIEEVIKFIKE
ncbi:MAG: ATP-binding protein [Eudoraea sp.]|nr:ATP-binding protein [Eudoraea sp.]